MLLTTMWHQKEEKSQNGHRPTYSIQDHITSKLMCSWVVLYYYVLWISCCVITTCTVLPAVQNVLSCIVWLWSESQHNALSLPHYRL